MAERSILLIMWYAVTLASKIKKILSYSVNEIAVGRQNQISYFLSLNCLDFVIYVFTDLFYSPIYSNRSTIA